MCDYEKHTLINKPVLLFGPPVRNYTFTKLWAYFRNAKTRPYPVQRFLD